MTSPSRSDSVGWQSEPWRLLAAMVGLVLFAHSPALFSDFVWDDLHFVHVWLDAFRHPVDFYSPPKGIPSWPEQYFRPLGVLSLKLDQFVFGNSFPAGWHAVNLLIHLACTWQVGVLVRRWATQLELPAGIQSRDLELIAMGVFAIHPVHVESVNWIAGRSDPLAVFFVLWSTSLSWRYVQEGVFRFGVMAGVGMVIGLLFKEVAIAAPVLFAAEMLLLRVAKGASSGVYWRNARIWWQTAAYSVAVITYLAMRFAASAPTGNPIRPSAGELAVSLVRAVAFYLQQLVPFHAQVVYPDPNTLPSLFASCLFLSLVVVASGVLFRLLRSGLRWILVCAAIWTLGGLWPSLLVIVNVTDGLSISERYLYLSSVGCSLLLAVLVGQSVAMMQSWIGKTHQWQAGTLLWIVLCPVLLVYGIQTFRYGLAWRDSPSLWNHALRINLKHETAYLNLLYYYELENEPAQREIVLKQAMEHCPDTMEIVYLYAEWLRKQGQPNQAIAILETRVGGLKDLPVAQLELARCLLAVGDDERARDAYREFVAQRPEDLESHLRLATLVEDVETASKHLLTAMLIAPDDPVAYELLAKLHEAQGKLELAETNRQQAVQLRRRASASRESSTN